MKKTWWIAAACLTFLLALPLTAAGADSSSSESTDGYLVSFREGCAVPAVPTEGMTQIHGNLYRVDDIALHLLNGRESDVEFLEKDLPVEMPEPPGGMQVLPEKQNLQAQLAEPADVTVPWQVAMVNPNPVWSLNTYGQAVKVAVIDTGCCRHTQLENVLCGGWNFVSKNGDYSDTNGHGTSVAGILAASARNNIVGIAPKMELYVLRCWEDGKLTSLSTLAEAVYAAVDDYGCQVINMSFQTQSSSYALHQALIYAHEKGVILIGAAGNYGTASPVYPGAYPEVISVASVGSGKAASSFSSYYGNVFVSAPGERCVSCFSTDSASTMSGTSQAAPFVSGAAALMLAMNPTMTEEQFRQLIIDTAEDLDAAGRDIHTGYGLLSISAMAEKMLENRSIYVSPADPAEGTAMLYNLSADAAEVFLFRSTEIGGRYYTGQIARKTLTGGQTIRLILGSWSEGEVLHVLGGPDGFTPIMEREYS